MTVKDKARQLFHFMRSLSFGDREILRCIFSLFKVSVHDIALHAGVSEQFVRQFLAGKKSSEKVAEAVKVMLFGEGSGIEFKL